MKTKPGLAYRQLFSVWDEIWGVLDPQEVYRRRLSEVQQALSKLKSNVAARARELVEAKNALVEEASRLNQFVETQIYEAFSPSDILKVVLWVNTVRE